jgi:hypothetical protein
MLKSVISVRPYLIRLSLMERLNFQTVYMLVRMLY